MHTTTGGGRASDTLAPRRVEDETTRGGVFRALHEIGVAISGILDPPELAHLVADHARELLHAGGAGLYVSDDSSQHLKPLHSSDADATAPEPSIPLGEGAAGQAFLRGEPVQVTDYAAWPHGGTWARAQGVAAALAVPLQVAEHRIGALSVRTYAPRTWSEDDIQTLTLLAAQVAPVLEAARFHEQAAELFERERLSRERLEVALEAGRMGAWDWDARSNSVTWSPQLEAIHGLSPGTFAGTFDAYLFDVHPEDLERVRTTIADSLWSGEHHLEYRIVWPDHSVHWVEARGRLLRDGGGEPIGLCGVCLDVTDRKLAELERARLMQSERAALRANTALEERQKLARELHDSVSQALYGIALGTQTALDALATDPDVSAADDAIRYVLELAESGLAEMRSLIFELRPESLHAEGLIAAIERNAAAARSRHNLHVVVQLCPEPDLTLAAKEAVYRIAQEALHNTVRHARAKTVGIRLEPDNGGFVLEVVDDGVGFDPDQAYPGHLGLVSMRERVAELGGELIISSGPGQGTRLRARASRPAWTKRNDRRHRPAAPPTPGRRPLGRSPGAAHVSRARRGI